MYIDEANVAMITKVPIRQSTYDSRRTFAFRLMFSFEGSHLLKVGGVAQLGEHLPCKQGVRSSILLVSTNFRAYSSAG